MKTTPIAFATSWRTAFTGFDIDLVWQTAARLQILARYANIDGFVMQNQIFPSENRIDRALARAWH